MLKNYVLSSLFLGLLLACGTPKPTTYDFPRPVDTTTRPVKPQEKKQYDFPGLGLRFDNLFDGARMNSVRGVEGPVFEVMIEPENAPINPSPWYAFRIESEREQSIMVQLNYGTAKHRYFPKLSTDLVNWTPVDSSALHYGADSTVVYLALALPASTALYVSAQEVMNTTYVANWIAELAQDPRVHLAVAGQSVEQRPIPLLDIYAGENPKAKETIVLLSRQHPPEVTGFMALQGFMDELMNGPDSKAFLERYRVLAYPLLNPDGVDNGHWRHNVGGIDLNRDWAYYHQPETRAVANSVLRSIGKNGKVILGLDFHSTYKDVYYTHPEDVPTALPGWQDDWLAGIEAGIGGDFRINESPGPVGRPTTKGWFATQFGAEGITYEIGDGTDRDFVARKGKVSAAVMMELLLKR